jgi:hypothetical protein
LRIKIERSGGFAGILSSSEMDVDKLPPSLGRTVRNLLGGANSTLTIGSKPPDGSADYLCYKISIQNGMKNHVVECNEFEMDNSVKSLVSYVQKNSKKKLR